MTCGYVCPVCEGNGFLEDLRPCDLCHPKEAAEQKLAEQEEWISSVHEGPCCSDVADEKD